MVAALATSETAGGTLRCMRKTSVYLPPDLDARLNDEAAATGTSKAELIRNAVEALLANTRQVTDTPPLPVFRSGRQRRTPEEMDAAITERIAERAARR